MTLPTKQKIYALIDGTWPASAKRAVGPWMVRIDGLGGNRVSATTAEGPVSDADIPACLLYTSDAADEVSPV